MSQLQSCENNPECSISFNNLRENVDNPMMCDPENLLMCIGKFQPSDADSRELYNAVTSCYSIDPQCMPSSGSGSGSSSGSSSPSSDSGSGSGSGSGFADCGSTPSRPVRNS